MMSPISEILAHKGGDLVTAAPDSTVADSVRRMSKRKMGSMLITEGDRLVGIFTERDVMIRVVDAERDPKTTPVSEVMTPAPQCVSTFITAENAMHVISEKRIRHLPVLEDDRLVGMITIGDLARWLARSQKGQMENLVRAVKNVSLGA